MNMTEQAHTKTNEQTNQWTMADGSQATRFTYQGHDYMITADGWRGFEIHYDTWPLFVECTDHVMRMWRYWLDEQNYQEQEDGPGLW